MTDTPEPASAPSGVEAILAKAAEMRESGKADLIDEPVQNAPTPTEPETAPEVEETTAAESPTGTTLDLSDSADDIVEAMVSGASASSSDQQRKADLEAKAIALGMPKPAARQLAYRTPLEESTAFLSQMEAAGHNGGAGQAAPSAENPATGRVPAPASPDIEARLTEQGVEVDTASAIAGEINALRAELAQVKSQAATAASLTESQHRSKARADFESAVGELSGQYPDLVSEGKLHADVADAMQDFLSMPKYAGNAHGAMQRACQAILGPAGTPSGQKQSKAPKPSTTAPAPKAPGADAPPLDRYEAAVRLAQTAGKFQNDPQKLAATLKQQAGRMRASSQAAKRRA